MAHLHFLDPQRSVRVDADRIFWDHREAVLLPRDHRLGRARASAGDVEGKAHDDLGSLGNARDNLRRALDLEDVADTVVARQVGDVAFVETGVV